MTFRSWMSALMAEMAIGSSVLDRGAMGPNPLGYVASNRPSGCSAGPARIEPDLGQLC